MDLSTQEQNEIFSYNGTNYISPTAIELRLNTQPILEKIELMLRGSRTVLRYDKDGQVVQERESFGKAKANEEGVQSILSLISSIINSAVVQGNFSEEYYKAFVFDFEVQIAKHLLKNRYRWEIEIKEYDLIADNIIAMVIPFLSRLINNKERESYGSTIRSVESNRVEAQKKGWSLFGKS